MCDCRAGCAGRARAVISRRALGSVAAGVAAAGILTACVGESGAAGGNGTGGDGSGDGGTGGDGGPLATVAAADVPVGGGIIVADVPLVVTQPEEGVFAAFGGTCTHQGCPVTNVDAQGIHCPCHSSVFDVATGEVLGGPAPRPLPELVATVEGGDVVVTLE